MRPPGCSKRGWSVSLDELARLSPEQAVQERYDKFRAMGNFFTESVIHGEVKT